jgi:hypothetical protein
MTERQTFVLAIFRDTSAGAMRFDDRWIWPQDIRDDAALADRMAATIRAATPCSCAVDPPLIGAAKGRGHRPGLFPVRSSACARA